MARAIRSLLVTFPPRTPSVIRGSGVGGIHQNSLCSVRYTKEPLRIRDGLLCLWLSTLGPLPSSPRRLGVNSSAIPVGWHGGLSHACLWNRHLSVMENYIIYQSILCKNLRMKTTRKTIIQLEWHKKAQTSSYFGFRPEQPMELF